jgi:hypothetical protein
MDFQENAAEPAEILSKPTYKTTAARMRVFLEMYAITGQIQHACRIAGIDRKTHYNKLAGDPAYQKAFAEAQKQLADVVEGEIFRRAIDGESDALLMFLARGFMPDKYRDRTSVEHSGSIGLEIAERLQTARERVIAMRRNDAAATG